MEKYHLIESNNIDDGLLSVWLSEVDRDDYWDDFLMQTPLGHFEQSSMWSQVKHMDGWQCTRTVATIENHVVGGFQILWRDSRLGKIGYISKGPVAVPETPGIIERLMVVMCDQARKNKVRALIVQPPNDSQLTSDILDRYHFIRSNPMNVIESTYIINVSHGFATVEKNMHKSAKNNVRTALKKNGIVREGTIADVDNFFDLMTITCKRQGTSPNPSSKEALRTLFSVFSQRGCVRLILAEYDKNVTAGLMCLLFGRRVILWKKGWDGQNANLYPNVLLNYEALRWSSANSYDHCDFVGIGRQIAETLLSKEPLTEEQKTTWDYFNVRFGGEPKLLPRARIWFSNPFLRIGYEKILVHSGLLSALKPLLS
jgi:lipid II:glycine glycyltransferase (peptidoglycan interpeptide bridge formation enzyme)